MGPRYSHMGLRAHNALCTDLRAAWPPRRLWSALPVCGSHGCACVYGRQRVRATKRLNAASLDGDPLGG